MWAPRTVLGLQPAPLGVHVHQLPLQLVHFDLGLVQLVLVGAAQLLSIGLQAPSTAWLSSALATDHQSPILGYLPCSGDPMGTQSRKQEPARAHC